MILLILSFFLILLNQCGNDDPGESGGENSNTLKEVTSFGTNPGNLKMYTYVPASLTSSAPLVVVIHGSNMNAETMNKSTGWSHLADQYQFYLAFAQQQSSNNTSLAWNWSDYTSSGDDQRGGSGEADSIKQIVDKMKSDYAIDSSKVFVTGMSSGGAMTAVMISAYPDVFNAGAIMAGVPYMGYEFSSYCQTTYPAADSKVNRHYQIRTRAYCHNGTSFIYDANAQSDFTSKTPTQWGDLVRGPYSHSGNYPKVLIIHGQSDSTVNLNNANDLVRQWTNLHSTDQIAESSGTLSGSTNVTYNEYENSGGIVVVKTYFVNGGAHSIFVDPSAGYGGYSHSNSPYYSSTVTGFHSTYYIAKFFGIVP